MTVSTELRPNATVVLNASVTGAGSGHAALSDSSTSSYISTSTGVSTFELGTFTLPSGAVIKSSTVFNQFRAGTGETATVRLTTAAGTVIAQTFGGYDAFVFPSFLTFQASTVAPPPNTQASIDGLRVTAETTSGARVAEVYAVVTYVELPVVAVTAVSPDPFTASNVVPIAWTNTLDADGGGQTRRRVKVFTAAQYGIGGFDPETSPFTWDSGEVLTSVLTASTAPLASATTYRAYVKVAQTVNGVAHWSAWAFDQFEVSVTTSDVLTVTVAAVNASARIDVTVNRDTTSAAWDFVEVQRSTDAGVSWSDVRSATYVDSTGNANVFTVSDWETGNGQATLYRARATRIVSGQPVTGVWVSSSSTSWTSTSTWLKDPLVPASNIIVKLSRMITLTRRRRRGVFDIIGSADPVVVSDVLSASAGTLDLFVAVGDPDPSGLLARPVVLLHTPASMTLPSQLYLAPGDVIFERGETIHDLRYSRRVCTVVEVGAPADVTAGQ